MKSYRFILFGTILYLLVSQIPVSSSHDNGLYDVAGMGSSYFPDVHQLGKENVMITYYTTIQSGDVVYPAPVYQVGIDPNAITPQLQNFHDSPGFAQNVQTDKINGILLTDRQASLTLLHENGTYETLITETDLQEVSDLYTSTDPFDDFAINSVSYDPFNQTIQIIWYMTGSSSTSNLVTDRVYFLTCLNTDWEIQAEYKIRMLGTLLSEFAVHIDEQNFYIFTSDYSEYLKVPKAQSIDVDSSLVHEDHTPLGLPHPNLLPLGFMGSIYTEGGFIYYEFIETALSLSLGSLQDVIDGTNQTLVYSNTTDFYQVMNRSSTAVLRHDNGRYFAYLTHENSLDIYEIYMNASLSHIASTDIGMQVYTSTSSMAGLGGILIDDTHYIAWNSYFEQESTSEIFLIRYDGTWSDIQQLTDTAEMISLLNSQAQKTDTPVNIFLGVVGILVCIPAYVKRRRIIT